MRQTKLPPLLLQEVAAHLPDVERPRIVHGPLNHIGERSDAIETNLRFDGICGRNAIGGLQDKRMVLSELANRLTPGTGGSPCQKRFPVRLSGCTRCLLRMPFLLRLRQKLADAEEAIYTDQQNPHVAWDTRALHQLP